MVKKKYIPPDFEVVEFEVSEAIADNPLTNGNTSETWQESKEIIVTDEGEEIIGDDTAFEADGG